MTTETLYATSLTSGTVGTSGNALGAPDGTFTTDVDNTSWTARFAMGNPTGNQANGTHTFTLRVRKETGSGNPDIVNAFVYAGSTQIATFLGLSSVTSTTGEDIGGNVLSSLLNGNDLSDIHVEVVTQAAGGNPANRSAVQLDGITWSGDFTSVISRNIGLVTETDTPQPVETNKPGFRSIITSFQDTDTWSSSLPAGTVEGNLLLGFLVEETSAAVTSAPSGWAVVPGTTNLEADGTSDVFAALYWKVAGASEPSPSWTLASAVAGGLTLVRYANVESVDIADSVGNASGTSSASPTISPSVNGCMVVSLIGADSDNSTSPWYTHPSGWTERADSVIATSLVKIGVADIVQATAGNIDGTWTLGDADGSVVFIVALAPAGGATQVNIGLVTETDTAQPVTKTDPIHRNIGLVTETGLAQIISRVTSRDVNQATESDLAQPVARSKSKAVGLVTEADLAHGVGVVTYGASETDTAQPVGRLKTHAVNQATESNLAQPITQGGAILVDIGLAW